MSVLTRSDELFDEAKELAQEIHDKIDKMHLKINQAKHPDTWGNNEYNSEFYAELNKLIIKSVKYQSKLQKFLK